jgi:hypothetical protein
MMLGSNRGTRQSNQDLVESIANSAKEKQSNHRMPRKQGRMFQLALG